MPPLWLNVVLALTNAVQTKGKWFRPLLLNTYLVYFSSLCYCMELMWLWLRIPVASFYILAIWHIFTQWGWFLKNPLVDSLSSIPLLYVVSRPCPGLRSDTTIPTSQLLYIEIRHRYNMNVASHSMNRFGLLDVWFQVRVIPCSVISVSCKWQTCDAYKKVPACTLPIFSLWLTTTRWELKLTKQTNFWHSLNLLIATVRLFSWFGSIRIEAIIFNVYRLKPIM